MKNKFKYNELVKIVSSNPLHKDLRNTLGTINGMSQGDDGSWGYTVFLEFNQENWCFEENELESTGKFVSSDHNMAGESIKVIVNPDGSGGLKDSD